MTREPQDIEAAARRVKKRELDRRAQQASRERTRSRIAYLEATVQAMTQQQPSEKIASLMEQLADMTRQRDRLAKTLSTIESTVHAHREADKAIATPTSADPGAMATEATAQTQWHEAQTQESPAVSLPPADDMLDIGSLPQDTFGFLDALASSPVLPLSQQDALEVLPTTTSNHTTGVIVPEPHAPCECLAVPSSPGQPTSSRPSIWRSANEALSQPGLLSRHVLQYEDELSEDIPIRVILEGWDAVERSQIMPPLWKKLRRTDELQFSGCGKTERLAILHLMHRLLRCQADPTPHQRAKLPAWYHSRPAQSFAHSSAIDFFVWPGVRERFIFSQHRYCSNFFWTVFTNNFRVRWPFEFRDCYKSNREKGAYSLSPDFQKCIHDIGSWAMTPDFFAQFPEMYADIPVFQSIPPAGPSLLHQIPQRQGHILKEVTDVEHIDELENNDIITSHDWVTPLFATAAADGNWPRY